MNDRFVPSEGIHQRVPFEEYLSWDAVNASTLKLFRRSAAHARQELLHPPEETSHQQLGHAMHASVLEPKFFDGNYVSSLPGDGPPGSTGCNKDGTLPRRSKDQKVRWQEFELKYRSHEIMAPRDYEYCVTMRHAAWAHPYVRLLLSSKGFAEVCVVWTDAETGLLCKARIDWLTMLDNAGICADIKTTKSGDRDGFSREIGNYDMHIPAAFYLDGLAAVGGEHPRYFQWIVIENFPPHAVAVYEPTVDTLQQGRWEYRAYLQQYKAAKESGEWPGYSSMVQAISLPKWRLSMEGR